MATQNIDTSPHQWFFPRKNMLSRDEEYHLFTLIWNGLPGAEVAREALLANGVPPVRHLLLRHPGCWYFDEQDVEFEAYTALAENIASVPPGCPNPAGYLYRAACNDLHTRFQSPARTASRDETHLPQQQFRAIPDRRTSLLHERLHQLPVYQQRALCDYFGLDFEPVRRSGNRYSTGKVPTAGSARVSRKRAYAALRRDQVLREAVLV